jgi:hypothetical protein
MTRSDLLDLVYQFHPRGMHEYSFGYDETEERFRQREASRRGADDYPTWRVLLHRLGGYHVVDHSLCLLAGWCVVAYSAYVLLPGPTPGQGHTLGFHVSLLGPYYGIHGKSAPDEEPVVPDLVRAIEAVYPGYEPIPPELGNEVVPDVGKFGKTTIYECIFSDLWESDSGPYQERPRDAVEPPDASGAEDGDADVEPEELVTVRDVRGGRSTIYRVPLADFLAELTVEERRRLS